MFATVCSGLVASGVFVCLLLLTCAGVEVRQRGCLDFFRFASWEQLESFAWKLSAGQAYVLIKMRDRSVSLWSIVHPAKTEIVDRILAEHLL